MKNRCVKDIYVGIAVWGLVVLGCLALVPVMGLIILVFTTICHKA